MRRVGPAQARGPSWGLGCHTSEWGQGEDRWAWSSLHVWDKKAQPKGEVPGVGAPGEGAIFTLPIGSASQQPQWGRRLPRVQSAGRVGDPGTGLRSRKSLLRSWVLPKQKRGLWHQTELRRGHGWPWTSHFRYRSLSFHL